jgi:hypothetical protein
MSALFQHFRFAQPGWLLLLIPALLLLILRRGKGTEATGVLELRAAAYLRSSNLCDPRHGPPGLAE